MSSHVNKGAKRHRDGAGKLGPRKLQRLIQAPSLSLFLALLWLTVFPLAQTLIPVDLYLRLDSVAGVLVPLAAKTWIANFIPALVVLALALAFGRLFCGYICPMGVTLDAARIVSAPKKERGEPAGLFPGLPPTLKYLKYLLLTLMFAAALFGVNLVFWGSPIALITRFYALLVHPVFTLIGNEFLLLVRPLADAADLVAIRYMYVMPRRFDTVYFLLALFGALFFLERVRPRFWCRYLCPTGALFGLLSLRPLWRRRVHKCVHCGRCVRNCPTGAIPLEAVTTAHTECITCRTCVEVCPVRGVRFALEDLPNKQTGKQPPAGPSPGSQGAPYEPDTPPPHTPPHAPSDTVDPPLPSRRAFLASAAMGTCLASLGYVSNASLLPVGDHGSLRQAGFIRPPGSRPEKDFLRRCLRCAQCMKACPTSGLQPVWFAAGVEGMFSPALLSRTGPCEPECALCGEVCPSQAIIFLPLEEKQQAKIGTAVVKPGLCLAWADDRRCMVCQEVCPYGAIVPVQNEGARVSAPVVMARRCIGCGFCEYHCPVFMPAITVQPLGALRRADGQYKAAAQRARLDLMPVSRRTLAPEEYEVVPEGSLPPGFAD